MRRPGIFERSVRNALRECLAGRPIPPEFLGSGVLAPRRFVATPRVVDHHVATPPDGTNIRINFHRKGDDDATF